MNKEILFSAKGVFELSGYVDEPLGPNEIRGKTVCTLVSQGTELAWANGDNFPIRPGYAAVFRVDEIGAEVSGIGKGEMRFCMGAHRETQQYEACYTLPLPKGLSSEMGVLGRLMGVSMTTLMTTKARMGDKVIVCGAGPVGILAAQNLKIGGYNVSVVEPDEQRRRQVEKTGIDSTFSSMPLGDPNYLGKVALVVDCSGHEAAVLDGCKIVRKKGEVVLVGVPWRKMSDHSAHDVMHAVFFNFVDLRSGWEWEVPIQSRDFVWEELLEGYNNSTYSIFSGFERSLDWLAQGRVSVEGLVHTATPSDPVKLYADISERRIEEPFIVLDWNDI